MSADEQVVVCGGLRGGPATGRAGALHLDLWAQKSNVTLHLEDLHEPLLREMPAAFVDLVEIAAYVYSADQATKRGGLGVDDFGAKWRRSFTFHIPVRRVDFWNGAEPKRVLAETLGFLADDQYAFEFYPTTRAPAIETYLALPDGGNATRRVEQVMMFSGGLDSVAGAVVESVIDKRSTVLVHHRSTSKLNGRQRALADLLGAKAGAFRPRQLNVRAHKSSVIGSEYTQRSRSFLFAVLGGATANILGLRNLRFYENGVVSLNLPVCAQVVGGRATRTTHPRVMRGFQDLLSLVAGHDFVVENPFLWRTKGDITKVLLGANCGELVGASTSCTHTWESSTEHTHCGVCSQCIDRRFGILAADGDGFDPLGQYRSNVFTQSFPDDVDKTMVVSYLARARCVDALQTVGDFIAQYAEVNRVLRHVGCPPAAAAGKILDLYRRHALEVKGVLSKMMARHAADIVDGKLPGDCLLRLVYESGPWGPVQFVEISGGAKRDEAAPAACKVIGDFAVVRFGDGVEVSFKGRAKCRAFLRHVVSFCKVRDNRDFLYQEVVEDHNRVNARRPIKSDRLEHDLFKNFSEFGRFFQCLDPAAERYRLLI
jgi:7-cyano-7-deazaguanine synthase in queuosine biosynthesis